MTPADTNPLREALRNELSISSPLDHRSWASIDGALTRIAASEPVAGTVRTAPADFKCESEEFNGPKCKSQCSSCRNIPSNCNPTTGEMENQETDPAYFEPSTALSVAPAPAGREEIIDPVKRIEMVQSPDGYEIPADPVWRLEIGGVCADFATETWANNFRNAILATLSPQHGVSQ